MKVLESNVPTPSRPAAIPICFCGSSCSYTDSRAFYGRSGYGKRWICSRFPNCRGSVGAHPDGKPLGTVPTVETKALRSELHQIVDAVWREQTKGSLRRKKRGSAYNWLADVTGWPVEVAHIGYMNEEQCAYALRCVRRVPYDLRKILIPRGEKSG